MTVPGERIGVLVAAGGAAWEVHALQALQAPAARAVVLKRCIDLEDLVAASATGAARVAVAAADLPGLDADSVARMARAGVRVVLVEAPTGQGIAGDLPGVLELLPAGALDRLAGAVESAARAGEQPPELPDPVPPRSVRAEVRGRVVAVWGPTGAPGRTTVAVNLAAELGRRGRDCLLVDADGYGGAVAQHLGVLDEASGLLAAVRAANAGRLDGPGLARLARAVAPGLRVLTGLPRADRWPEVRPPAYDAVLDAARRLCPVVVLDLGFSLEQDPSGLPGTSPQRNHMTVAGLEQADEIVVVGSADPVGLARLARALVDLPELVPTTAVHVVVNRSRPSLGWSRQEVAAMVNGFVTARSIHFLPDEPASTDRALVAGAPLTDGGRSPLTQAFGELARTIVGDPQQHRARGVRRRRAGRAR